MWFKLGTAAALAVAAAAATVAVPSAAATVTPQAARSRSGPHRVTARSARSSSLARSGITAPPRRSTRTAKPTTTATMSGVALKHGGFEVNSVVLNQKTNAAAPMGVEQHNLLGRVRRLRSGQALFYGTGMYAGITGTVHITETFAAVGGRYATRPKEGPVQHEQQQPATSILGQHHWHRQGGVQLDLP